MLTCSALLSPSLSQTEGGLVTFDWRSSVSFPGQPDPATSKMIGQVLQPCELYVFEDWSPVVYISLSLLVTVYSINVVIDFIRGSD